MNVKQPFHDKATGSGVIPWTNGYILKYKLRMGDLDVKLPKLRYWYELDEEIEAYVKGMEHIRKCTE